MVRFGVSPEKERELAELMARAGVREPDLEERFVRGSGAGGQKINKSSSTVQLRHMPSGVEVRCQRERSQALNRFFARRELCYRILAQQEGERSEREQEREKIRRQKRRRSRRAKERMLIDKRLHGEKKRSRGHAERSE